MAKFNPKVEEFLKEDSGKTLLGLGWSIYWRWTVIWIGIYIVAGAFLSWID